MDFLGNLKHALEEEQFFWEWKHERGVRMPMVSSSRD
jgi:hypothetical protein